VVRPPNRAVENDKICSHRQAKKGVSHRSRGCRSEVYDHPDTGLKTVFQQAKAAVASQFGRRSSEYQIVAAIRY
jgi:hypothetical protein